MGKVLGIDIGIASVGWAVIDDQSAEIEEAGVRLFESADVSKNADRRSFRGIRRNKRRQKHRLLRVSYFLEEKGLSRPENDNLSPLELRVKGLTEQLESGELFAVLYNIAKHRGVSYLEDLEEVKEGKKGDAVLALTKENEGKLPCEIQFDRYQKYGFYRGTRVIDDKEFLNTFTIGGYEKEARHILSVQSEYHSFIDEVFIEDYINILKSKREYYHGPGNEKNRTNYGIYKTDGRTLSNLFDELRGKCSVYNGKDGQAGELRASAASYTVQYYNLLNDLCNIKVDGRKLSQEEKEDVITYIKAQNEKTKISVALKELYDIDPESVTGFRIDKANKEENHSFDVYRAMVKSLEGMDVSALSIETLDEIADILTLNTETQGISDCFKNKYGDNDFKHIQNLSDADIEALIVFRRKNGKLFKNWSSFSYKLINQITPEMLATGDEQQTCIQRLQLRTSMFEKGSQLNVQNVLDEIYNPVVRRSILQTMKILKELLKTYDFSQIVIEMPRDNNNKEQKDRISKLQKNNEDMIKKAIQYAGLDEESLNFRNNKELPLKLKLFYKQQGRCLYSGESIDVNKLIQNTSDYEIDHIIPISISFDDSQANKVLVQSGQNRKKSNMSPFQYLSQVSGKWNYGTYKAYVLELYKGHFIGKKQKELLLFEEDITKQEVVQGFINRNLNDTRYAARVVLNTLQDFFKSNEQETKIKVINGTFTNQFRKKTLDYQKERELDFRHHAVDAMICCYSVLSLDKYGEKYIDVDTGDILNKEQLYALNKNDREVYLDFAGFKTRGKILDFNQKIKFSHKVDRKVNRPISNQTIYSTREVEGDHYVVNKIKDIYDDSEYKKFLGKLTKSKKADGVKQEIDTSDVFLMKKHDPQTWQILEKIRKDYPDAKNPFRKYREEYGPIRKYSKKGNGPEIRMLKYLDHKMGSHLDITHHYDSKDRKVILESLTPYRSDVYYDEINHQFNLVTIRYNDFRFHKGKYILSKDAYAQQLIKEGLIQDGETFADLEKSHHTFRFSLYRNDVIAIGEEDKVEYWRFLSKNASQKNRFEVKAIDCKLDKQKYISLKKTFTVCDKYNVDILGNMHIVDQEELVLEFQLDNDKI